MEKLKVLFFAANPAATSRLNLDEEIRVITEKIQSTDSRDSIELVAAWAARPDDLLQMLNKHKPQIVHFSAHGNPTGKLILLDQFGLPKPVNTAAIQYLFKTLKDNIRVVVLNACYSQTQAQAIINVVDCAIGMKTSITNQAAIIFAASFYRALGFGRSVKEAFEQGRAALMLEDIPEENIPELLVKEGVDPAGIFLRKEKKKTSAQSLLTTPYINIGLIPILLALISSIIAFQHIYNKQKSTLYLVIGSILFFVSGLLLNKASGKKEKKMKKIMVLGIILSLLGFAACSFYISAPSQPVKNELFHIFENRDLNGSIVVVLWDGAKGKGTLIKNPKSQLKIDIFKKFDDGSIETVYKPEIESSGVTVISELPEGEYCVGISFNGIILDYVDHVRTGSSRVEFIELINKNPEGTIKFEAVDQSNRPLSGIRFDIWSDRGLPFRGGRTLKNGQTNDFWIYSLTDKSIGSYYAVAEMEDEASHRREVWRSKPFRPFFKYVGDKCEVMRAIINLTGNLKK